MGLDRECERAIKFTIPAVRVAVSLALSKEYGMSETDIARRLGVAQPAISKYLNGNYSVRVRRLADAIKSENLHRRVVHAIVNNRKADEIADLTDSIASGRKLVAMALRRS